MYYSSFESTSAQLSQAKKDGYCYAIIQQDKTGIIGMTKLVDDDKTEFLVTLDAPDGTVLMNRSELSKSFTLIKPIHIADEYQEFLEKFDKNRIDPIKMAETVRIFKNLVCEVAMKWHHNFYGEETRGTTTEELQELREVLSNLKQALDPIYIAGHQNFEEFSKKLMRKIYLNEDM